MPYCELNSEIAALEFFAGNGAAHLYASDPDQGALMIGDLEPGETLATLVYNNQATKIAAWITEQLWRPVPDGRGLGSRNPEDENSIRRS